MSQGSRFLDHEDPRTQSGTFSQGHHEAIEKGTKTMCLILLAIKKHPQYKLIAAANRDEFYDRPTAPAAFWNETPHLLGGRDLLAGGTWLGITRQGRLAAVTNYRDPASLKKNAPTRGKLVSRFLSGRDSPTGYLDELNQKAFRYNGFNLIVGDRDSLFWYSNRGNGPRKLSSGLYGLSNHLLDTAWPKISRSKAQLASLLRKEEAPSVDALFHLLGDQTMADEESLPDTGVGIEWERILSAVFIKSPDYGTRSSTLIFMDTKDHVTFIERTFDPKSEKASTLKYEFQVE